MADNNLGGLGDETLANAQGISRAMSDIAASSRSLTRELGQGATTFTNFFNSVQNSANKVADIQNNALKTHKATSQALGEQTKQLNTVRALNVQISSLMTESAKLSASTIKSEKERGGLLKIQAELLVEARDSAKELASVYGRIASDASKLDSRTKFFTGLSEVAKSVPILNKLASPFEKAAEAARKVAVEQAKVNNIVKSGNRYYDTSSGKKVRITNAEGEAAMATQGKSRTGAALKAGGGELLSTMTSMTSLVGIVSMIAKFVFDIFLGAQQNTVQIAKNLGITRESADKIRLHFVDVARSSDNILVTSKSLLEAQGQLVDSLGVYTKLQDSTLENQVFLTQNLAMSAENAADLNLVFEAQGLNAEKVTNSMNETNNAAAKATGRMVPFSKLMAAVAKTSLEIKGYFGFNTKAIAEGVRQMSKFGLELSNAASVSKTLLDFESSIGNELTLELLTGKEFNLERARTKAVTGDIAGATADVMQQMQNLTEEQRKNPLIMESMASLSGLTADQLNRAYLVNKKLTKEQKDYVAELQKAGKEKEANQATDLAMQGAKIGEIKKTLDAQQAFNAALEKAKDSFTGLVSSGAMDQLTDAIIDLAHWIGEMTGANAEKAQEQADTLAREGTLSQDKATELAEQAEGQGFWRRLDNQLMDLLFGWTGIDSVEDSVDKQTNIARRKLEAMSSGKGNELFSGEGAGGSWDAPSDKIKVNDFKIMPLDKDTITMAGGTKLGGNVEELLKELISAVRGDKHIYIGATAVNEALGVHTNKVGAN